MVFAGCSASESDEETVETVETTEVVANTEEVDTEYSQEDAEDVMETYLQIKLEGFDIELNRDSKVFYIVPKDRSAMNPLVDVQTDPEVAELWEEIAYNFENVSEGILKSLGEGYVINFQNPYDESKTLLLVKDGQIVYNFTEDL